MKLNSLELTILNIVLRESELSSAEIHSKITGADIAYSTLSFALRLMIIKKVITYEKVANKYFYRIPLSIKDILLDELRMLCAKYECRLPDI